VWCGIAIWCGEVRYLQYDFASACKQHIDNSAQLLPDTESIGPARFTTKSLLCSQNTPSTHSNIIYSGCFAHVAGCLQLLMRWGLAVEVVAVQEMALCWW
jgi:hypothetical protein